MWKTIKDAFGIVDPIHKIIDGVIWLAGLVVPSFFVSSWTLWVWMIVGGSVGVLAGFFVTTALFRGAAEKTCRIFFGIFFALAVIAFVASAFLLMVLKPDFAVLSPTFVTIREVLLRPELAPNVCGFVLGGLTLGFSVSAVTLLSPSLRNATK